MKHIYAMRFVAITAATPWVGAVFGHDGYAMPGIHKLAGDALGLALMGALIVLAFRVSCGGKPFKDSP